MDLPIFPIHKKPEYLKECCKLINSEWKRSETARLRSLATSCDHLPVNLILLKENQIIGHAKLSKIPAIKDACFVESVVIKNDARGYGYGSYLMNKVEDYSRNSLQLNAIYLSTKGQERFYEKLGYIECEPIQIFGGPVLSKISTNIFNSVNNGSILPPRNNSPNQTPKTYMRKLLNDFKE